MKLPITPDSDFRKLLAIGVYCAYILDTKGQVHAFTANADSLQEFVSDILSDPFKFGIAEYTIFVPEA